MANFMTFGTNMYLPFNNRSRIHVIKNWVMIFQEIQKSHKIPYV